LGQSTNPNLKAKAPDPRLQGLETQPHSQQSPQTKDQDKSHVSERYAAIQELRKVNFRQGQKPYQIYTGSLNSQFKSLKLFSITTSAGGLVIQPMVYQSLSEAGLGKVFLAISPLFFFTYVTPFLINILTKRYATEMFYNPVTDTYTAVTSNFFLQRREVEFKAKDVIIPDVPGMFTTFLIKSNTQPPGKPRPIFVMDTCFTRLEHYGRLMKFDEPINLHLGDSSDDNSRTK
jgi:transmembrane protein 70